MIYIIYIHIYKDKTAFCHSNRLLLVPKYSPAVKHSV